MTMFSIIIPVYNLKQYLDECLASLYAQSVTDYELILIDDGSTDGCAELCDEYARVHPNNTRVIHKQNGGQLRARIEGVKNADGEYCVFVDSDDKVSADMLKTLSDTIDRYPELDIILYSFAYWDKQGLRPRTGVGIPDGTVFEGKDKETLYQMLITDQYLNSLCTKAVKTELLRADPTDYSQYYGKDMGEDLLWSLYLITAAKRIIYLDAPLYWYRINSESTTRKADLSALPSKNSRHVYYALRKYMELWGLDTQELIDIVNARWVCGTLYIFRQYYYRSRGLKMRKYLIAYPWSEHLPKEAAETVDSNPRLSHDDAEVWKMLENHSYARVMARFEPKRIRKRLKTSWR